MQARPKCNCTRQVSKVQAQMVQDMQTVLKSDTSYWTPRKNSKASMLIRLQWRLQIQTTTVNFMMNMYAVSTSDEPVMQLHESVYCKLKQKMHIQECNSGDEMKTPWMVTLDHTSLKHVHITIRLSCKWNTKQVYPKIWPEPNNTSAQQQWNIAAIHENNAQRTYEPRWKHQVRADREVQANVHSEVQSNATAWMVTEMNTPVPICICKTG